MERQIFSSTHFFLEWEVMATEVTRYNLAYINHSICHVDNGRVLGFENAHDYHHRHYMGEVAARKADQAQAFDGKVTLSFELHW
jgi:hypothetical protein